MKNAQNYNIRNMTLCEISQKYVHKECSGIACDICLLDTVEWLNKKKEIDWKNALIFSPVRVRDNEDEEWEYNYYFIDDRYSDGKHYFIVSDTVEPESPGFNFAIFNECDLL